MVRILAVCTDGIGVNIIAKARIKKVLEKVGIDADVQFTSLATAKDDYLKYDVLMASNDCINEFKSTSDTLVIGLDDLMCEKEIKDCAAKLFTRQVNFA